MYVVGAHKIPGSSANTESSTKQGNGRKTELALCIVTKVHSSHMRVCMRPKMNNYYQSSFQAVAVSKLVHVVL